METKTDHIKELNKTVIGVLQEVVSLKATVQLHKNSIEDLTNQNTQLTKDLEESVKKVNFLNIENASLSAEKTEVEVVNKEYSDSIKKLKKEKKALNQRLEEALTPAENL